MWITKDSATETLYHNEVMDSSTGSQSLELHHSQFDSELYYFLNVQHNLFLVMIKIVLIETSILLNHHQFQEVNKDKFLKSTLATHFPVLKGWQHC